MMGNVSAQKVQENMVGRAGLPSEKPCAKTLFKCKALLCVCNNPPSYKDDNAAEEAIRAPFPARQVSSCPDHSMLANR